MNFKTFIKLIGQELLKSESRTFVQRIFKKMLSPARDQIIGIAGISEPPAVPLPTRSTRSDPNRIIAYPVPRIAITQLP